MDLEILQAHIESLNYELNMLKREHKIVKYKLEELTYQFLQNKAPQTYAQAQAELIHKQRIQEAFKIIKDVI